jgi:hypothetical protein
MEIMDKTKSIRVLEIIHIVLAVLYLVLSALVLFQSFSPPLVAGILIIYSMTFLVGALPNVYSITHYLKKGKSGESLSLVYAYGALLLVLHFFIMKTLGETKGSGLDDFFGITWIFGLGVDSVIVGLGAILLGFFMNLLFRFYLSRKQKRLSNKLIQ